MEALVTNGQLRHYPLAYGDVTSAVIVLGTCPGIPPVEPEAYQHYLSG